ncbi:MAG: L,D-transpeptidase/peptidoglycan binding protein [Lachnospiraceae bacterium]|nr:L,D-transpeptidase/peptidoglycan binding protein [Lachnospiraceae bacterium]
MSEEVRKEKAVKKDNKKLIIGVTVALAVLIAAYTLPMIFYGKRFLPKSSVNGINSGGKTVSQVVEDIENAGKGYSLTIKNEVGPDVIINASDIDLTVKASEEAVQAALNSQNVFLWPVAVFKGQKLSTQDMVSFDENKLSDIAMSSDVVTSPDITKTEDAYLKYTDGKYDVVPEVYGTEPDPAAFKQGVKDAVSTLSPVLDLSSGDYYIKPDVTADSEELKAISDEVNGYLNASVTYEYATEKVDADRIISWVDTEDGQVTFDTAAIASFVDSLAEKYDTIGLPKTLETSYGATVTVPGGTYGWEINREEEAAQIIEDIKGGQPVTRDFIYTQTAASHTGNDYGNSYVEANITAQEVILYVDGAEVARSDVVSGDVSKDRITHVGAYYIQYKEKDAILKGENYRTHVNYWMPFHIGEGLHDAVWRSSFGGQIYQTDGSHGCLNMPLSAAKTFFGYVDAGFPVLVYQLPGTERGTLATLNAQACYDAINAIGEVTAESGMAIAIARSAYEALSDPEKAIITNYQTLVDAETAYYALTGQGVPQ